MNRPFESIRNAWGGVLLVGIVAVCFAANTALAGVAYTGGSNALSVLVARTAVAFVVLYVVLTMQGVNRALPARQRYQALALGVLLGAASFCILKAVEYMPVALAVVMFYTYPIFVALAGRASGRESLRPQHGLALMVAFAGIVLALDVTGLRPHPVGVPLAFAAALAVAAVIVLSDRVRGNGDSRPVTLHMLGTVVVGFGLASICSGRFTLPDTAFGWVGFIGAPMFYSFAIIVLFVAIAVIGSLRASLVMNIEPVASVVLGFVLLGQRLSLLQLTGVALVVGAVVLVEATGPQVAADLGQHLRR